MMIVNIADALFFMLIHILCKLFYINKLKRSYDGDYN